VEPLVDAVLLDAENLGDLRSAQTIRRKGGATLVGSASCSKADSGSSLAVRARVGLMVVVSKRVDRLERRRRLLY
jgi:hypothetical protein